MSQISDVGGGVSSAKPKPATAILDMTDAQLADEHRGHSFAKQRASEKLAAIETELERRQLTTATGKLSVVTRHENDIGLIDLKRLREDHPDLCRAYAQPGSRSFWRSGTLPVEKRS